MRIAFFDCFSGISGNMILGALLDAGLELTKLEAELGHLGLDGYRIVVSEVQRSGIRGQHVEVEIEEQGVERHLHDIEAIIKNSELPEPVKGQSLEIFGRLARAEAKVHGEPVDHIHFHEVGAMDAIVDVVGSVTALWLLGVEQVYASRVHIGRGGVECAHGLMPVPAPATAELLRGVPVYGRDVEAELVTPTGAAILTTVATGYEEAPPMRVTRVGYGAGSQILPFPNLLRVSIGDTVDGEPGEGHKHPHEHSHAHSHAHPHEHGHGHAHPHEHSHTPEPEHDHKHPHEHAHGHAHPHEHNHAPEPEHDHEHPHEHAHEHEQKQPHVEQAES